MILIPEIETVLILTPRTASGSLKNAVLAAYPDAMQIYRHMEADGVPQGYDRWRKVGVVRHPVERLWSLYKFLQTFDGPYAPAYIAEQRGSVGMSFSDWIVRNEVVFTAPYDRSGAGRFYPKYTVRHPLPENRKSQFFYLRPDLGTTVFRHEQMPVVAAALKVTLGRQNATPSTPLPSLSNDAADHVSRFFNWDLSMGYALAEAA